MLSFIEFCSAAEEEKLNISQPVLGQYGHLCFPIGPEKNPTNLAEDVKILLLVKFPWISFSGYKEEIKKTCKLIRGQGGHLGYPICPKKH